MFKRPHYIVIGGVVLLGIVLVGMPKQASAQIKLWLGTVFLPALGVSKWGAKAADKATDVIMPRRVLEAQVEALKKENQALKLELAQQAASMTENQQLRAAVAWQKRLPWTLKLAKVLTRDPANWWRTVQIDAGSQDGLAVNMPVLTMDGLLVGRVDEVGFGAARVVLLGDPNCRVAAKVRETGDRGVIAPGSSTVLDQTLVQLTFLPRHSTNRAGFYVYTSGEGGIYPRDVLIGRIAEVESVGQGLYMEARVKVAADLRKLETVWVMLGGTKQ